MAAVLPRAPCRLGSGPQRLGPNTNTHYGHTVNASVDNEHVGFKTYAHTLRENAHFNRHYSTPGAPRQRHSTRVSLNAFVHSGVFL